MSESALHLNRTGDSHTHPASKATLLAPQQQRQVSSSSTSSFFTSSSSSSSSLSSSSQTSSSPQKISSNPAVSQNKSQTAQVQVQPQPQAQPTRSSIGTAHNSIAVADTDTDTDADADADAHADAGTAADGNADDGIIKQAISIKNDSNRQATARDSIETYDAPTSPSQALLLQSKSLHAWDIQSASAQDSRHPSIDRQSQAASTRLTLADEHENSEQSLLSDDTADVERRLSRFWTVNRVTNFTDAYNDDNDDSNDDDNDDGSSSSSTDDELQYHEAGYGKKSLPKLWKSAFKDFERPQPYECTKVPRGRFLPITKPEIYMDMLRDPESLSPEQLYALTANTAAALKAWQDEYFAIDNTIKLVTRQFQKKISDPRQPEQHATVWEDKKEALLYGFKHDPNHQLIGHQDPFIQGGFKPTAIQAKRMKEKAKDSNNVDGWTPIARDGRLYIPGMRQPAKPSSRRKFASNDTSTKTVTRAAQSAAAAAAAAAASTSASAATATANATGGPTATPSAVPLEPVTTSTVDMRLVRKTRFGGGRHPAVSEKIDKPLAKTNQQQSTTKTTAAAPATTPATTTTTTTTRGRRGRPPAQPQAQQPEVKEEARISPKEESQKRDAAEAASILTSLNEVTMPVPTEMQQRNGPLLVREEQQMVDIMQRPAESVEKTLPEQPFERQLLPPPPTTTTTAAAAAAAMTATLAAISVETTASGPEAPSAPPKTEVSQSPRPTLPLCNPLLDPKNQEKIRLSKNPKRTEAMIMHWAKFNSEGRMRNPKRTKAQIEAAKVTGMNDGISKPGRKRKARAESEAVPQPSADGTKFDEQITTEMSTKKRPKPSSRAVTPTTLSYPLNAPPSGSAMSPLAPKAIQPQPPHASLAPSEILPASAPLPPHHTIPAALHPPPHPGSSRHLVQPVTLHHPNTPISLPPPQSLSRNNPHQIAHYTTISHHHHPPSQPPAPTHGLPPPPPPPPAAASYTTTASAPHILYSTREQHSLPPPYHLPPSLSTSSGPPPAHHHHHHHHRHHHHGQYPPAPPHQPPPIPPPSQAQFSFMDSAAVSASTTEWEIDLQMGDKNQLRRSQNIQNPSIVL
ncbi:hypothetical protein KEM54_006001 [Ascosphaera aggregata]|nr:hypothetical protein KEM54_006001 [Ascosphaera aggregata]